MHTSQPRCKLSLYLRQLRKIKLHVTTDRKNKIRNSDTNSNNNGTVDEPKVLYGRFVELVNTLGKIKCAEKTVEKSRF